MREAAADLDFEQAARLRDEIKRLRETELAVADDPLARDAGIENTQEARRAKAKGKAPPSPRQRGEGAPKGRMRGADAAAPHPAAADASPTLSPRAGRGGSETAQPQS